MHYESKNRCSQFEESVKSIRRIDVVNYALFIYFPVNIRFIFLTPYIIPFKFHAP